VSGEVPGAASAEKALGELPYLLVTDAAGLGMVRLALAETALAGLDTETTGLDPRKDRVRLLTLDCDTTDGGRFTYLVDCFAVDPRPLWDVLAERQLIIHNGSFDLSFLAALGFEPGGAVHCTETLSRLLHGTRKPRGFHTLAQVAERELGRTLDKTEQLSDWSGNLKPEQLRYAVADAAVLLPLYRKLADAIRQSGQEQVARIERDCLPGMVWVAGNGIPFDKEAWLCLAEQAERDVEDWFQKLATAAPPRPGYLEGPAAWNFSSDPQVKEMFALAGIALKKADDDALAGIDHPLAGLLRGHRAARKLATTYGRDWLGCVGNDGRVRAEWRQLGCITGRMACAKPNLQQVPGDPRYRACFRALPGRVLIKGDYSQVELRIAAKVTGDRRMLEAYRNGEDLHTLTARQMTGRQDVTREERSLAKPVNFGLIYGLGSGSLRRKAKADYGLDMSAEQADQYRRAFFATYPGIPPWHSRLRRDRSPEVRTLTGRRVPVKPDGFYGGKANYIVQGTGGDAIKAALGLLWQRRGECPGAFPVAVVHDEILLEADEGQAEAAREWLRRAIVDALAPVLDPMPAEAEVKIGRTWGGEEAAG
jgi:DNA polymerase-1